MRMKCVVLVVHSEKIKRLNMKYDYARLKRSTSLVVANQ